VSITFERLQRVAQLDATVFDDIGDDARATAPALVVAGTSMVLLGLGGWLWWWASGLSELDSVFIKTVVLGTLFSLALWLAWLLVVYLVLQRVANVTVEIEPMLRAAGFACAPLALGLFMVIPGISFGVGITALGVWAVSMHTALRRATGVDGGALVLANAAGFGLWAIVMSLLATSSNQIAPGPFLAESIWDAVAASRILG
jgi:hypothetical protein